MPLFATKLVYLCYEEVVLVVWWLERGFAPLIVRIGGGGGDGEKAEPRRAWEGRCEG